MHHGADLVERDAASGGDADREHQQVARGRAAFNHCTVERQVHRLARGRVDQSGSSGHHAQRIGQRAGPIGAKRRVEVGGKALGIVGCQQRFVHRQRRFHAGGADARPIVLEHQVLPDVQGRQGAVAVAVGLGRDQRHQVVRGQARRVIRIGWVGMHHGANLVERDAAIGGHTDREHQQVVRGRTPFHHRAIERQVHHVARGCVGQPGGSGHHAQRIGQRASPIGAKRRVEVGGIALAGVGFQYCLVHRQRRLDASGADTRPVVLEHQVLPDVEGRLGTVAVAVGLGRDQRHQVVRGQARRIIGIGCVGMHHGADLVERDAASGGDTDREHQQVARGCAAFDHSAVK
ncbi:hypothetical protein D3C76_861490 [compost metagenome]